MGPEDTVGYDWSECGQAPEVCPLPGGKRKANRATAIIVEKEYQEVAQRGAAFSGGLNKAAPLGFG